MPISIANLVTTDIAAQILGVSETRVRQLRLKKRIKAQHAGPILLFDRAEMEAFAKQDRPTGRPKQNAKKKNRKHGR